MSQLRRVRPGNDLSVSQLTISELQHEISRRIDGLNERRAKLQAELEEIEQQLHEVRSLTQGESSRGAGGPRRRPKNTQTLKALLTELLDDGPRTARELADAALERGYRTTSKKFVNNVTTALNTDERFLKQQDGRWTVTSD